MSREIKFRLVCKDMAGNIFYRYVDLGTLIRAQYSIEKDGLIQEIIGKNQYTGLSDHHGKEIYEGDILKLTDAPRQYAVAWKQDGFVIMGEDHYVSVFPWKDDCEVVGNIYENPELLKEP